MPGVPPDAVDNVKKLLKGIFKRGRNKKQDIPAETAAPAQPPAQTNKPLPPTQPPVSGEQDKPQDAIPIGHSAQPGPTGGSQEVHKQPGSGDISPTSQVPVVAPSQSAAAPEKDAGTAVANADGAANVPKTEEIPDSKDNAQPVTATGTPVQANGAEDVKQENSVPVTGTSAVKTNDENVPAQGEPPVIPTTKPAPGMSATSGPLEDYPEQHVGEDERKN